MASLGLTWHHLPCLQHPSASLAFHKCFIMQNLTQFENAKSNRRPFNDAPSDKDVCPDCCPDQWSLFSRVHPSASSIESLRGTFAIRSAKQVEKSFLLSNLKLRSRSSSKQSETEIRETRKSPDAAKGVRSAVLALNSSPHEPTAEHLVKRPVESGWLAF